MKKSYRYATISIMAGLAIIITAGCTTVDTQPKPNQAETLAALVKKAAQFKGTTLVFKGFYVGMPKEDAYMICDIYKFAKKAAICSPDGKLTELRLNSDQIIQLFSLNEINPSGFVNRFAQEYKTPPPEFLPGDPEVNAGEIGSKSRWKITDGKTYEVIFEYSPAGTALMGMMETSKNFTLTLRRSSGSFD